MDDEDTARLGIPKFPAELKRRLKVRAVREGTTLREITVQAAEEFLADREAEDAS